MFATNTNRIHSLACIHETKKLLQPVSCSFPGVRNSLFSSNNQGIIDNNSLQKQAQVKQRLQSVFFLCKKSDKPTLLMDATERTFILLFFFLTFFVSYYNLLRRQRKYLMVIKAKQQHRERALLLATYYSQQQRGNVVPRKRPRVWMSLQSVCVLCCDVKI